MSSPLSTCFIGTHAFAATVLQGIHAWEFLTIQKVITQPDKPVGRKGILTPPPVKLVAQELGILVDQPETLKGYPLTLPPEIIIVAQYGRLIPSSMLDAPRYGVVNTHTSLLPKYRGASPIQAALLHGDTISGVTIMKMDAGLDTGPIILQKDIAIADNDTYATLETRLATVSIDALKEAIPAYVAGTLLPIPQDETQATHCYELSRDSGKINWQQSATEIYNQWRAYNPWPGVWTTSEGQRLKLLDLHPASDITVSLQPGEVYVNNKQLYIGTATSPLEITSLQKEGKAAVTAAAFIAGYGPRIHQSILD